uniref:Uncharacterized protein n=1 Tax=Rhizophora mucronata TaxID=61149 RepID=A0A2P2IY97_RHIMU
MGTIHHLQFLSQSLKLMQILKDHPGKRARHSFIIEDHSRQPLAGEQTLTLQSHNHVLIGDLVFVIG